LKEILIRQFIKITIFDDLGSTNYLIICVYLLSVSVTRRTVVLRKAAVVAETSINILNRGCILTNLTIIHGKFVCLSYFAGAFCFARSWTLTVAFESLGLRYVHPYFAATSLQAARGGGWVAE